MLLSVNTHITGILSYTSKVSTDFYFFSGLVNKNPNMMQNDSSAFQLHDINGGYLACCNLPIDVSTFPKNPKMNTVMTPAPNSFLNWLAFCVVLCIDIDAHMYSIRTNAPSNTPSCPRCWQT